MICATCGHTRPANMTWSARPRVCHECQRAHALARTAAYRARHGLTRRHRPVPEATPQTCDLSPAQIDARYRAALAQIRRERRYRIEDEPIRRSSLWGVS